ncbi:MAG: SCO family protein [Anaerolineales bacterium]
MPILLAAGCARIPSSDDDARAAYAGSPLHGPAPDFALTDQFGARVRLGDFRGRVVALTFFDSRCRDVCPLTSAELIAVWLALTPEEQGRVALLGVNVNAAANAVEDVAQASEEWRLAEIPAWHFVTGSPEELRQVWQEYPIEVQPDPAGESISHTSGIFLVDSAGNLRWYVSVPLEDPAWDGRRLAEILVLRVRELLGEEG